MNRIVKLLAATSVLAFSASASLAQGAAPTGTFMDGLPYVYEGRIGGLDAWSLEGSSELWLVLPDGQHVIGGYVFNRRGYDIGSVTLGMEPVNIWESLGIEDPANPGGSTALQPPAQIEPAMGEANPTYQAPDPSRDAAVAEAMRETGPLLSRISDVERRELLEDLVHVIAEAETPEAFQIGLIRWRERVTGEVLLPAVLPGEDADVVEETDETTGALSTVTQGSTVAALIERALAQAAEPAAEAEAPAFVPVAVEAAPQAQPDATSAAPAMATSDVEFFGDFRQNTFWFSVGNAEAPSVYMVYDPACPHCARSIRNLEPRISAGELQLRVILVPMVSDESLGLAAGILASATPVETFMENALQRARFGSSDLVPGDPATLPVELLGGIQTNIDFMQRYEVSGVPFFGWMGPNGPQFLAGVPARDYVFNAQVDTFSGNE